MSVEFEQPPGRFPDGCPECGGKGGHPVSCSHSGAKRKDPSDTDKWLLFSEKRHDEPRWKASQPTGAFDNPLASFRFTPRPYSWTEILSTVGLLYGVFVLLPALAGIWAGWRIGQIVGWW